MQIHGFRIACGSDKAEVVRKELQVLWRSREWSAEEWQLAAAQHTAETQWKRWDWGGDRYHHEEPCTPVAGTSHVSGQCVLADGSQKTLPPAETETIQNGSVQGEA